MSWLHRVQQRLSITKNEALTLLSLSLFLLLGTVMRHACRQARPVSAEYYAEIDSLLAERSSAALEPAENHLRPRDTSTGGERSTGTGLAGSTPLYGAAPPFDSAVGTIPQGSNAGMIPKASEPNSISEHPEAGANSQHLEPGTILGDSDVPENTPVQRPMPRQLHIDLNRATLQELDLLPRVGPRTAERIIAFREAYGSFRSVDELLSVSGIGPKTLEQIRPHVYVTVDSAK